MTKDQYVEPLARAKGHGTAHKGTHHYIAHKITSVALMVLAGVLAPSFLDLAAGGFDHTAVDAWLGTTPIAPLLALFIAVAFFHFYGLLEEVILDYLPHQGVRILLLSLLKLLAFMGAFSTGYLILFMSGSL